MKKILTPLFILMAILLNISLVNAASLNTAAIFDTTKLDSGIIAVGYNVDTHSRLKVMIEKEGKKITYNLKNDGTTENFPLQFGNGEYNVSILENIGGDKYKYVSTESINLDLTDDNKVYLASIQNVNWNDNMATIKKAEELTKDLKTDSQKINAIYQYLVSNISNDYEKPAYISKDYLPKIDDILASGKGICYDYSSVFAAMLRSIGIPAKLVKGYSPNVSGYHAWNEIYNSDTGKWIIVDASYDARMKAAKAKYSMEKENSQYNKIYEY